MELEKSQEQKFNHLRHYHKYGKIIEQKNVCDLIFLNFRPQNHIKKLSKNTYIKIKRETVMEKEEIDDPYKGGTMTVERPYNIIKQVGEVQTMAENNERNKRSLRKIFNDMRYLINTNFTQEENTQQVFLTLTYKENMQDYKRLYSDYEKFYKKLKRLYKETELGYIVIMEPQERGAWHAHMLLKVFKGELYFDYDKIREMWGQGAVFIEKLKNVSNFGSYFVAYMSNAEIDDKVIAQLEISPDDVKEKDGKRYIKGTRLLYYKDYMQIYRHSRNIKKPSHHEVSEELLGASEDIYPTVAYKNYKEIPIDEERSMKIGKEQRKRK